MDWKNWKNEKTFSSQRKSGNFEQTGKVGGILASFYFLSLFSDLLIEAYLLNRFLYLLNSLNKNTEKYWKWKKKYWEIG